MRMHGCHTDQVKHLAEIHHLKEHCDKLHALKTAWGALLPAGEDSNDTHDCKEDMHEG